MEVAKAPTILIVDDEVEQLRTLQIGLRRRNYEVMTASKPDEALQKLFEDATRFDMVLTDYAMPGMNGLEFLKKIRIDHKDLFVILMTAYGKKEVIVDALRNQCNGFIEKPFTMEELIEEIERVRLSRIRDADSHEFSELIPQLLHQINNPLSSIVGSAQLAMFQTDSSNDVKERLTCILEATQAIMRINKEILNLGKGLENNMEAVDLREVLNDCLQSFEDLIRLKGVSVEKAIDARSCTVSGNRFGLGQVLRNLILNAVDAMDGVHEKILKVGISQNGSNDMLQMFVEDTGCGIKKELIDKAFKAYFTTKEKGTGLGLTAVKSIVDSHRGKIEVDSEPGKGSLFAISLPIRG